MPQKANPPIPVSWYPPSQYVPRGGVVCGFTGRHGGVSSAPYNSLQLAKTSGVSTDEVLTNWARALARLDRRAEIKNLALVNQIHGAKILHVSKGTGALSTLGDGDALVCTTRGVILAIRVADCVPVLLGMNGGIAAIHSGWRGTALNIVGRAVHQLCAATGGQAHEVTAWLGPHISQDAYEVGNEVVRGLEEVGLAREKFARRGRGDRWHVDLAAVIGAELRSEGVTQIEQVGPCTSGPDFFSYRHDGPRTGRQVGVIAWF